MLHRSSQDLDMMDRSITAHVYMANIVNGQGDVSMFLTIVLRMFIGLELCSYVNESNKTSRVIKQGLRSLWFMGERIIKKHKVGFSGDEREAVIAALCFVDRLAHVVTPAEYKLCTSNASMKIGGINLTMQSLEPYKDHT